jgi:GMP synthase-like glutamine amidotransferase
MHQDQVASLPDDGVVVASTAHCPNAVIRVGATMLGIQAHPEFPGDYVEALLHAREERIGHDVVERALESLAAPRDEDVAAAWIRRTLA